MGLLRLYLDYYEIITSFARYDDNYVRNFPTYGRYKPSKDLIHHETWQSNGTQYGDYTNSNNWYHFYYPRRHKNIPENESIYDLFYLYYGGYYTDTLWDYIRFKL